MLPSDWDPSRPTEGLCSFIQQVLVIKSPFFPGLHCFSRVPLILLLFSHSVLSDSLRPHGLQHARLTCPSPSPRACSNSCPFELVMPFHYFILCCLLLLLLLIFPNIRVFSDESALCIRWPKYRNFSFSISPSNEYSGLISFRIDWFDFLEVRGTLKSLLQHHSSNASVFQCSAFFMVQLSHPYMTTRKTIALLARWCLSFFICCLGLS